MTTDYDWYHRAGTDPWTLAACKAHGAELVKLGFEASGGRRTLNLQTTDEPPQRCPMCAGTTSLDDVRACKCNELGTPCPVHKATPAGAAGELVGVCCGKCGAELQLPADRLAFEERDGGRHVIAVDVTGWAERNGDGAELRCPFHGSMIYYLERVPAP